MREWIPSKRGRVPSASAEILPGIPVEVHRHREDLELLTLEVEADAAPTIRESRQAVVLFPGFPQGPVLSRFMAKVGLEAMVARVLRDLSDWSELIDHERLDCVRDHARRGTNRDWPVHLRHIYNPDRLWRDSPGPPTQVVHEFDILKTDSDEYYCVAAIFGLELAINLGGPEIGGYRAWLERHGHASPLYSGKNAC